MLKNVLSLLLSRFYSKQENEAVAQQAMPSRSIVALVPTKTSIDLWGVVFEGTAPTNGYASISFTASSDFCIASAQSYEAQTFSSPKTAGDVLRAMCPVAKGRKFILCARNAKNITCEFIETIGGGYQTLKKLILQGGGLCCLNGLSSSLRRSSWLARRSGSDINHCRTIGLSWIHQYANMSHRLMDGLGVMRTRSNPWMSLFLRQMAYVLQDSRLRKTSRYIHAEHFLSQKVRHLKFSVLKRLASCGSHLLTAPQLNVANGGASC